jgi:hypothetical protein
MPERESLQVPQRKSNVLFEECWKPITGPLAVGIGDVTKSKTAVELVNLVTIDGAALYSIAI